MVVKCNKSLAEYKYVLAFDLASKNSGVVFFNIETKQIVFHKMIIVKNAEVPSASLWYELDDLFHDLVSQGYVKSLEEIFVVCEAAPQQAGKFSTIQTLVSLARSHATLDNYLYINKIDTYDWTGIYPITCKSYYKRLLEIDKPQKEDISKYLFEKYALKDQWTLDETDALSLIDTLLFGDKWNKDIEEKQREIKKHKKTLKLSHAINECDEEIQRLEKLKI
jgi:hypothetical protein